MHFEISHDEHRERYRRLQAAMARPASTRC